MELRVLIQAWQFLLALGCGVALALVYDFLWGMRRELPGLTWLGDLVIGLCLLFGNLLLLLYVGDGEYRIFFLPATALGFFLWCRSLSPLCRRGSRVLWHIFLLPIHGIRRILKKILEKLKIFLKNPFSNRKKSVKIKGQQSVNGGERGA